MYLLSSIKKLIKSITNIIGYDINKLQNKNNILNFFDIDLVLDVGGNIGQTRDELRRFGYRKKILSFEPLEKEHNIIKKRSLNDNYWSVYSRCAIGDNLAKSKINVSKNSYSSSILDILPSHLEIAEESIYIKQEDIEIITLDSIFKEITDKSKNICLKIDTQGYESNVLDGLKENLKKITIIDIELSFLPLYENQKLWDYFVDFLFKNGFEIWSIKQGVYNLNNGRTNQINVIFYNKTMRKIPSAVVKK